MGTGNVIKETELEPCFNNWYNCTSSIEQWVRKISDLLFWPVFSPSPTSYFLNIYFFHFSPPSPSLKFFQKETVLDWLSFFYLKAASPSLRFLEELSSWMNQATEAALRAAGGGNCSNSQNVVNQKLQGMNYSFLGSHVLRHSFHGREPKNKTKFFTGRCRWLIWEPSP